MEEYSILIVDDEMENINLLKIYINTYYKSIKQLYTATSPEEAINSYLEYQQDILLLDVELENSLSCFSILEALPNITAEIIFVTSHEKYAIEAINTVQTTGYLLKPVKPLVLVAVIDKAINNLKKKKTVDRSIQKINNQKKTTLIAISSSSKIEIIHIKDIIYLEADGRYTIFYLTNNNIKIASKNLGEYEKQFNGNFFRVHHRYIVNLSMVSSINKTAGNYCELINGKTLPIAKRRQDELHKFLNIK